MRSLISRFFLFMLLAITQALFPQSKMVIYDGITGIVKLASRNDTGYVALILPGSPADKEGLQFGDQLIRVNDSLIAGKGELVSDVRQLLVGVSGTPVTLEIKKKGEDTLRTIRLVRDTYSHSVESFSFEYLVDSLEQWDIGDMISGQASQLFTDVTTSKITVRSVDKGSPAEEAGFLPGDRLVSLTDEVMMHKDLHVGSASLASFTDDTCLTVARDSLRLGFDLDPSVEDALKGIKSRFQQDLHHTCLWFRITAETSISEDRTYLFDLPQTRGSDSVSFFEVTGTGEIIERRAGNTIPVDNRDYVYKNWSAIPVHLEKGEDKTLYIRLKTEEFRGFPYLRAIVQDTIRDHDRTERMILSVFAGMMLIVALYYLVLFSATLRKRFLFFSLYILSTGLLLFTNSGYHGEFSWNNVRMCSIIDNNSFEFLAPLVAISFLLFGSSYLELKRTLIWWYRAVLLFTGIAGISLIATILYIATGENLEFLDTIIEVTLLTIMFTIPFLLIIPTIFMIRRKSKPAWYFLASNLLWVVAAITVIYTLELAPFSVYSLYESSFVTIMKVSLVYLAVILQFLMFSLGLAQKMKMDEKEKQLAQERVIEQLKENEKLKDKVNRELEQKVQERTREINAQKEEIMSQRDEIEAQRDEIEAQRDLVVEQRDQLSVQKQTLTDSIAYAQRIQAAVLPHQDYLEKVMPEYFILFRPRDMVSGDFYWVREIKNHLVVVAADCTGHGVPGAFMSMLGITLLNELVDRSRFDEPGKILDRLRQKVKDTLAQKGKNYEQKDGMDMALAILDRESLELRFAGAYNPLFIIREKDGASDGLPGQFLDMEEASFQLFELKGDPQPIAIHAFETGFTSRRLQLRKGDTLYAFSDGYVDQKGGPKCRKFMSRNFKKYLLDIQQLSMQEQKDRLEETLDEWMQGTIQIDDILVMGIRV